MNIISYSKDRLSLRKSWIFLIALIFFLGCTQEKEIVTNLINPPIPELIPAYSTFQIDASQGGTFSMPSGTVISIPPGALIDSSGNEIQGKVDFQYREFHDAVRVFLSGIPMEYEKSGIKQTFQTAGMFDLNAKQNGQMVFINSSKKISVKLASYEGGNDYNFWWLDEKNKSWEYIDRRDPEVNPKKEELKKLIEKLRPTLKFPLDEKYFALNYNSVLDVYYRDNWQKINDNKQKAVINKKSKEYGIMWTSIYSGSWINFKGNEHKASLMVWKRVSEGTFPGWIFSDKSYNGCTFERVNGQQYRMQVESEKGVRYSVIVEPVMPLKALFAFPPEYWKKNYDEAMEKVYEEEKRIKLEADVFRTFELSNFGIYNYDKFWKEENKIIISAEFNNDKNTNPELTEKDMVFCIPEDNKTLIKYPKTDWDKVALLPGNKVRFLSVLPGSVIAVYTAERYEKINFDSLKLQSKPNYKFTLISNAKSVKSEDDLRKLLGI